MYDDHDADTRSVFDQQPEGNAMSGFHSRATGDYRYSSDPDRYGYNAADLLEFRARPTDEGVAYRVTLNTMLEPDAAAVVVGIDVNEEITLEVESDASTTVTLAAAFSTHEVEVPAGESVETVFVGDRGAGASAAAYVSLVLRYR